MGSCPKCSTPKVSGEDTCRKCGIIFSRVTGPVAKLVVRERSEIQVMTGDLARPYRVLRPLFAYVTDQGGMLTEIAKKLGIDDTNAGAGRLFTEIMLFGEGTAHHQRFPVAFAVCVELLKLQGLGCNADAITWMRFDMDVSQAIVTQKIYAQAYGTAVAFEPASAVPS